jgi:hypothetical protein
MRCLQGRVEYRLKLQDCSSQSGSVKKKRQKPEELADRPSPGGSACGTANECHPSSEPWRTAGFYLVLTQPPNASALKNGDGQRGHSTTENGLTEFLLSIPHALCQMAVEVATTKSFSSIEVSALNAQQSQWQVRVLQYKIVPLIQNGVPVSSIALLQVHTMEKFNPLQPAPTPILPTTAPLPLPASRGSKPGGSGIRTERATSSATLQANDDTHSTNTPFTLAQLRRHEVRIAHGGPPSSRSSRPQQLEAPFAAATATTDSSKDDKQLPPRHTKPSRHYYTILAKVDAVSPIIAMDPSDPFALMELYDEDEDENENDTNPNDSAAGFNTCSVEASDPRSGTLSCVVVLKGAAALKCHAALLPGDKILLKQVLRKPWAILASITGHSYSKSRPDQDTAQHLLHGRIPQHVIVVTDANSISWQQPLLSLSFSLPSTVVPLIAIRGTVVQVEHIWLPSPATVTSSSTAKPSATTTTEKRKRHDNLLQQQSPQAKISCLHWVEIVSDRQHVTTLATIRYRLYLTHFPLSPAMQICLAQPGTVIYAINVHVLQGVAEYISSTATGTMGRPDHVDRTAMVHVGACLRSTVTFLQHAGATRQFTEDLVNTKITGAVGSMRQDVVVMQQEAEQRSVSVSDVLSLMTTLSHRKSAPPSSANMYVQVAMEGIMPYCFSKIRRTYPEYILRQAVTGWLVDSDCLSLLTTTTSRKGSCSSRGGNSVAEIVNDFTNSLFQQSMVPSKISSLLMPLKKPSGTGIGTEPGNIEPGKKSARRNPYAEFFDHCSDYKVSSIVLPDDDFVEENYFRNESGHHVGNLESCGCDMSSVERRHDQQNPQQTCLLGLEAVRSAGIMLLVQRLERHCLMSTSAVNYTGPKVGSTGSIHVTGPELVSFIQQGRKGDTRPLHAMLHTGGVVVSLDETIHRDGEASVNFSIRDNDCQLPGISEARGFVAGELVLVRIESIVVSFLCIAPIKEASLNDRVDSASETKQRADQTKPSAVSQLDENLEEIRLPPVERASASNPADQALHGSCSVIRSSNRVLVASVQCRCSHSTLRPPSALWERTPVTSQPNSGCDQAPALFRTIQDCLQNPRDTVPSTLHAAHARLSCLHGILVRQRYIFASVHANGKCKSCVLTLAHIPSMAEAADVADTADSDSLCCVQSIEVKVSVSFGHEQLAVMKKGLSQFMDSAILNDHVGLAASWWSIADRIRSCALVAGGYEEWNGDLSSCRDTSTGQTSVYIQLPVSAIEVAARGFVRFACDLEHLKAFVATRVNTLKKATCKNEIDKSPCLDFAGGTRPIRQGTLDRRPRRRRVVLERAALDERVVGERYSISPSRCRRSGVSTEKIIHLFHSVCTDLRDQSRRNLAPSLVRRVVGARFLGVLYCQAQCKCTRCYGALIASSNPSLRRDGDKTKNNKGFKRTHSNAPIDEPSFWHVPNPMDLSVHGGATIGKATPIRQQPAPSSSSNVPRFLLKDTTLRCPKNCSPENYTVNWECSGILDDGTGQAKLYASGEAALTLLGMNAPAIESIETGAWFHEDRVIRFQNSKPPPPYLKYAVQVAVSKAHAQKPSHSNQRPADAALRLLTPKARAEYVMQHHCRSSTRPQRYLDYLVRCKPLSDTTSGLNQTEAKTFSPRNASGRVSIGTPPTYSLPPLALDLVDCCCPSSC